MINIWSKEKNPETFEEAVIFVSQRIDESVDSPRFHFTGGMKMRNSLNLWDKSSALYKNMVEKFGLCHADDTSSLITEAAKALKNGVPFDPWPQVEIYKKHWVSMGYNPAKMNEEIDLVIESEEITAKPRKLEVDWTCDVIDVRAFDLAIFALYQEFSSDVDFDWFREGF